MSTINAKKQTPTYIGHNWTLAGDFDKKKKNNRFSQTNLEDLTNRSGVTWINSPDSCRYCRQQTHFHLWLGQI